MLTSAYEVLEPTANPSLLLFGKLFSSFTSHSDSSPPLNHFDIAASFSGLFPKPPIILILPHLSFISRTFSVIQSTIALSTSSAPINPHLLAMYLSIALDCPIFCPLISSSGTLSILAANSFLLFAALNSLVSNPPPSLVTIGYLKSSNSKSPTLKSTLDSSAAPRASKYISFGLVVATTTLKPAKNKTIVLIIICCCQFQFSSSSLIDSDVSRKFINS
mmetsp:Transcript_33698/g.46155  ORF Transcript_33698/g.46155 Transcript_33698/m.46155 type:complete len:219 (+) Transcript_33698:189-845(+)